MACEQALVDDLWKTQVHTFGQVLAHHLWTGLSKWGIDKPWYMVYGQASVMTKLQQVYGMLNVMLFQYLRCYNIGEVFKWALMFCGSTKTSTSCLAK